MTARNAEIFAAYSRVAFVYDAWTWMTERRSLAVALERAAVRDGEAVLEIAVGTGVLFGEILRANPSGRNVGVDLTEAMLRRARQKAERTGVSHELRVGDARHLPFEDDSFDLLVNCNMLGIVPEPDVVPILREMRRVLRPGGRLVIVTMARPPGAIARAIYRMGAGRLGRWSDIEVAPFLEAAGLAVARRDVVRQLGIPSEVLVAR